MGTLIKYIICCCIGYGFGQFALYELKKALKSQKDKVQQAMKLSDKEIKVYRQVGQKWVFSE